MKDFYDDVQQGKGRKASNMVGDEPIFRSWSWKAARGGLHGISYKPTPLSRQEKLEDLDNQYRHFGSKPSFSEDCSKHSKPNHHNNRNPDRVTQHTTQSLANLEVAAILTKIRP